MARKSERPEGWAAYKIDGKVVPSVTTIYKTVVNAPALNNWIINREVADWQRAYLTVFGQKPRGQIDFALAAQEEFKRLVAARPDPAGVGTLVHQAIEEELWSGAAKASTLLKFNDEGQHAFEHWLAWSKDHELKPYGLEVRVFSREHRFAGTIDYVGLIDGVFTVADYKTSKGVYKDHLVQIAAYRHALRETLGVPVEAHGLILRFPQDQPKSEIRPVPWHDQDELFARFLDARRLYEFVQKPLARTG